MDWLPELARTEALKPRRGSPVESLRLRPFPLFCSTCFENNTFLQW